MRHQTNTQAGWETASDQLGLPAPKDCETLSLLRSFLNPVFEQAETWQALRQVLASKGYGIAFSEGHLVLLDGSGRAVCTGSTLGVPLRSLSERLGRPSVRASVDGHTGVLH
ncbi:hypothetical protein [Pacificoceanicola onchidii]|uniref:hypothetical protein n=1 Tax=Pacificoceanicola onchidii TaxID=2562685 RepID=UPI0010A47824|nr:hypothetical protein [Pacificoceanicola onchidii]